MSDQLKAIIIDEPSIDRILEGAKTWEMRKRAWKHRGTVALIRKGSKTVVGLATLAETRAPLESVEDFAATERHHRIPAGEQEAALEEGSTVPWVLTDVRRLAEPVPYEQTEGRGPTPTLSAEDSARVLAAAGEAVEPGSGATVDGALPAKAGTAAAPKAGETGSGADEKAGGKVQPAAAAAAEKPAAPATKAGGAEGKSGAVREEKAKSGSILDRFVRWLSGTR